MSHAAKSTKNRRTPSSSDSSSLVGGILKFLLWSGLIAGATAFVNALIFYRTPPLRSPLGGGAVRYWPTPQGDVFYKTAGSGPPLLLVHSIGAGCSSYEFRRVWEELARDHTVYALDLLGFGKSDKPALDYSRETYIQLLLDFARDVIQKDSSAKIDVIATSLPAAYAVAAAHRAPSSFGKLILICPTGLEELTKPTTPVSDFVRSLLRTPVVGTALYNLVASRPSIYSYLVKRVYADAAQADTSIVEQFHTSAHQPGGEHVLPSFIAGHLNADIRAEYAALTESPLVIWGREAVQSPVSRADAFGRANPSTHLEIIDGAGMLPHEERPEAFLSVVHPFLAGTKQAA